MSSRSPRRAPLLAQRIVASGLLLGLIVQMYGAGLMWYGVQQIHRTLGWVLILTALLAVLFGAWANGWQREAKLAVCVSLLLVLQPVFVFVLAPVSPFLGGLHALNAGLALLVAFTLVWPRSKPVSDGSETRATGVRRLDSPLS